MKHLAFILMCIVSAGISAQNSPAPSPLEQARHNADIAARHESDLSADIASQERGNAALRELIRNANVDPASVQKGLVDASADAAAVRRKVAALKLRYDVANDNLAATRARAIERVDQTESMRAAQRAFDDVTAEMDRVSQPIFDKLSENPDYQEAQALADTAAQTGEALQRFDAVDPKAQADADAAFDMAMSNVRALEDAAVDADPKAAETHKALKLAQEKLDSVHADMDKRIAADPKVDAAKFALDVEQRLLNQSSADLAVAEKKLAAIRQINDPNAGATTELANQLKAGETRLHELTNQLDQARVARINADDHLRYLEDTASAQQQPDAGALWPLPYSPAPIYQPDYGGYGDGYGYAPAPYYTYDPFYCPPCYGPYWSSGLFFGTVYYSHSHFHHSYSYDHYCNSSYYHHNYHDSSWHNSYDHWRGNNGAVAWHGGNSRYSPAYATSSSRLASSSHLGRADLTADSRLMTDYARHSSISSRDYLNGTRVSTYNYYGGSAGQGRQAVSSRSRQSEQGTVTISRPGASRSSFEERSATDDARHASYSDSSRTSRSDTGHDSSSSARSARSERGDITISRSSGRDESRSRSSDAENSHARAGDDSPRHSSGDTSSARARGSDSPARSGDTSAERSRGSDSPARSSSADSARSRGAAGSAPGASAGAYRSRGSDGPSSDAGASRSRGSSGPSPSSGAGASRSRGSAGSSPGSSSGAGRRSSAPSYSPSPSAPRGDSAPSSRGGSDRGTSSGSSHSAPSASSGSGHGRH